METNRKYPAVIFNREAIRHNTALINEWCSRQGIFIAGVIKGFNANAVGVEAEVSGGVKMLASSRLEHLARIKRMELKTPDGSDVPTLLIRMPMLSEISEVINYADYSLNTEMKVLDALNEAAGSAGITHRVILMTDLGDLREGWFETAELVQAAIHVERDLAALELAGIGTNLGCVGSITPTGEKMDELAERAAAVEEAIGRKLDIISGGATTSLKPLFEGVMNPKINMLRIGEGIPIGLRDQLPGDFAGYPVHELRDDCVTLDAEIIELNTKPTYPIGEIGCDAFGRKVEYIDRGNRKRAILAVGRADYGDTYDIIPELEGATIWGASSDHTIVDIEDVKQELRVGDIIRFKLRYKGMLHLTTNTAEIHQYEE